MLKRFLRNLGIFIYIVIAAINIYLTRNGWGVGETGFGGEGGLAEQEGKRD